MAPSPRTRALFRLDDAADSDADEVTVKTKDLALIIDWLDRLRDEKLRKWSALESAWERRGCG